MSPFDNLHEKKKLPNMKISRYLNLAGKMKQLNLNRENGICIYPQPTCADHKQLSIERLPNKKHLRQEIWIMHCGWEAYGAVILWKCCNNSILLFLILSFSHDRNSQRVTHY
jgi:hypothetical protein